MKREELEKMDKSALIDIVLKQQNEMETRDIICRFNRDERDRLQKILDAVMLVLNNVKK